MRLIEPLGLLHPPASAHAVAGGFALYFAGGPAAFTHARLVGDGRIVPITAIPAEYQPALAAATAPRPWAGLPPGRVAVMGVLNVTPDSFSDGGRHAEPAAAIAAGRAMLDAGADLLDIGGESTRPHAAPTPPDEDRARILPVSRALAAAGAIISVDTRHAATMRAALSAGARIINDVSGLAHDPESPATVAAHNAPVILMHMRATPDAMHHHATYTDVAAEVAAELAARISAATAAGIAPEAIAIDPGIGFAKTAEHNRELLARLPLLTSLGRPLVVGVSRKGFIGLLSGEKQADRRTPGSIAAGLHATLHGANVLRVHDVAATVQALRVWQGLSR